MCHETKKSRLGTSHLRALLFLLSALGLSACAATPPPNATGPRPNEPLYPVLMVEADARRDAALAAWNKFAREQGIADSPAPELQPVTATVRSLPTLAGASLYLPKVGDSQTMNEEETRESLRRFIASASAIIGAEPQQLSLVRRVDAADGTKQAFYEQRPFRYPLRGGFGKLSISFTPDRRVLQITSTCIPDIEQLQRAGAGIRPRWEADKVAAQIVGRTFTFKDSTESQRTLTVSKDEQITVRELVIYPILRPDNSSTLEFHLAWEIKVGGTTNPPVIYLDAVTDEVIATE